MKLDTGWMKACAAIVVALFAGIIILCVALDRLETLLIFGTIIGGGTLMLGLMYLIFVKLLKG